MNMNYSVKILFPILLLMLFSIHVKATDGINCNGTITTLGVHGTDRVMLKLSGMNALVQICNLNQTMGSTWPISPEQCKVAYSTLLTAYSMKKFINVYFDNVQNGTSCSTFVQWEVATARWVYLSN